MILSYELNVYGWFTEWQRIVGGWTTIFKNQRLHKMIH